jgi:NAD+ kinase
MEGAFVLKVGILVNQSKGLSPLAIKTLISHIQKQGSQALLLNIAEPVPELDTVISFGGDGTVLAAARYVGEIPIFGVNMGHLGFLTEIEYKAKRVLEAVSLIIAGEFIVDKRKRLAASVYRKENKVASCTALNDMVIKGAIAKLVRLKIYIGGNYVGDFPSDGIIVSTATGSTGYSLSAGGPIIPPDLSVNLITPICSHLLNVRPMLASDTKVIRIVVESHHKEILLSADGQVDVELENADCIQINTAAVSTNLIRIDKENFYGRLSEKLKWGEV